MDYRYRHRQLTETTTVGPDHSTSQGGCWEQFDIPCSLLMPPRGPTSSLWLFMVDDVSKKPLGMRLLCRNNFGNNRMEKELRIIPE